MFDAVDVFVLAGGGSTRMGVDKATLVVDGEPLLSRVVSAVGHLGRVHVVGGHKSLLELEFSLPGEPSLVHIPDAGTNVGPFAAVVHALGQVTTAMSRDILLVACDLALLTSGDADRLVNARRSSEADYAVPLVRGRRQWHGLAISPRIVPRLRASYASGERSMRGGFSQHSECLVVSASPTFFADVDTPADVLELMDSHHRLSSQF